MSLHLPRRRPRYADVAATLALVLAASGTAYAATALPRNSVGTPQLKSDAVTAAKIKTSAVGAPEIEANAVTTSELKAGAVTSSDIKAGAVTAGQLKKGAVTTAKIAADSIVSQQLKLGAVTEEKIAQGAVGTFELQTSAVSNEKIKFDTITGEKVADDSLGLADLVGADGGGTLTVNLGANACTRVSFAAPGAVVGQAAIVSFTGETAPVQSVVAGPAQVDFAGFVSANFCSLGGAANVSVPVRVVTFG